MAPLIQIDNLSKAYDDVLAVDNISLNIEAGELFCLLGASGCGKTTLLRMLAGFETPTSGKIYIDGRDMAGIDPADRPVNIMFQNYALFPHMRVADNIAYGLRRAGLRGQELESRVKSLLALVRLDGLGHRKPHQLSGGQRQRVALARALARQPKLLLLYEPLAALDKKLREETQFELMNIQDELGTSFMVVTHDQEEAMVLANRIGVMRAGKLEQVAAPRHLYEAPQNRYVADFLGTISFLEATITKQDGDLVTLSSEGQWTAKTDQVFEAGAHVSLAVRPEKLILSRTQNKGVNEIAVRVEDYAYLGVATHYRVRTKAGTMLQIMQANGPSDEAPLSWDEEGFVSVAPSDLIILTK